MIQFSLKTALAAVALVSLACFMFSILGPRSMFVTLLLGLWFWAGQLDSSKRKMPPAGKFAGSVVLLLFSSNFDDRTADGFFVVCAMHAVGAVLAFSALCHGQLVTKIWAALLLCVYLAIFRLCLSSGLKNWDNVVEYWF